MARTSKPLREQVIVFTGATSGIGLTTACMAASKGAKVVMADRNEAALETICTAIRSRGGECTTVVADVGVRADIARIAEHAIRTYGGFDTWVNNAGVGAYARLEDMSDEDHQRLFQGNHWAVVHGPTEALKTLKKRGTRKNLHQAGEDGKRHGDQGHRFSSSLYTTAKMYPVTSLALVTLAVLGIAALARPAEREGAWRLARDAGRRMGHYASDHGYGRPSMRGWMPHWDRHSWRDRLPWRDRRPWWERGYDQARDATRRLRSNWGL